VLASALSCASLQTHSLTHDQRIGAGHSIMTVAEAEIQAVGTVRALQQALET
jgi:hypothetical protein